MSRSINELMKALTAAGGPKADQIENPDIPQAAGMTEPFMDKYHSSFKTPSQPRNGMYAMSLPREPRNLHFMADGDIDPNVRRAKIDPDSALPPADLGTRARYEVPPAAMRKPHNQIDLIKKSHTSELNYRNRFTPSNVATTQPVA